MRSPTLPSGPRLVSRISGLLSQDRLLLSVKAGLAAAIAWSIALAVPGVAAEYPYYAPLGAIVSMYPTIAGSARQAAQTLAGLVAGILLALPVILLGNPSVVSVALVVGIGVLLAGLPKLGAGKDWLPMAALFVLLLGGDDADGYSLGYTLQMLVGIGVGLSINMLVFPPLHLNGVVQGLDQLRTALARQLADMGAAIEEKWPPEHEQWASRRNQLSQLSQEARNAVQLADSSRHGNLRRRRYNRDLGADYHALQSMERIAFYVEDMTEVLADAIWDQDAIEQLPVSLGDPLAHATSLTARAVEVWDAEDPSTPAAEEAVEELMQHVQRSAVEDEQIGVASAFGMGLRRILLTIRIDSDPDRKE